MGKRKEDPYQWTDKVFRFLTTTGKMWSNLLVDIFLRATDPLSSGSLVGGSQLVQEEQHGLAKCPADAGCPENWLQHSPLLSQEGEALA